MLARQPADARSAVAQGGESKRVPRTSATVGVSIVRLGVVCLLLLAAPPVMASAGDQDTQDASRATLLSAEREKKAAETTPPERSFVERTLYWYDNQDLLTKTSTGWRGIHRAGGDFPQGPANGGVPHVSALLPPSWP